MTDKLSKIQILRYATGVTAAMAISQGVGWFLSYIVPVLLIGFLKPPAANFSFKDGVKFVF